MNAFKIFALFYFMSPAGHLFASDDSAWGFCKDGHAYSDAAMNVAKPKADWICGLPTADASGIATTDNILRCRLDQKRQCDLQSGGSATSHGDHNVPGAAWYVVAGAAIDVPKVRCQCGCFTGDVEVLTDLGSMRMDEAAKKATKLGGLSMAVMTDEDGQYRGSERLGNGDFVVGPEDKPVVHIETVGGRKLTMTDTHPVLVLKAESWNMVQAGTLAFGDTLMTNDGSKDSITSVSSYLLPEGNRLVYNFDTKGKTDYEHVITANHLRVGDLHWQNRLSEKESRTQNFLQFAVK